MEATNYTDVRKPSLVDHDLTLEYCIQLRSELALTIGAVVSVLNNVTIRDT